MEETQKQRKIKKHNLDFFHTASEPYLQSPVSEQKEKPGWNFNVEEKEAGKNPVKRKLKLQKSFPEKLKT